MLMTPRTRILHALRFRSFLIPKLLCQVCCVDATPALPADRVREKCRERQYVVHWDVWVKIPCPQVSVWILSGCTRDRRRVDPSRWRCVVNVRPPSRQSSQIPSFSLLLLPPLLPLLHFFLHHGGGRPVPRRLLIFFACKTLG